MNPALLLSLTLSAPAAPPPPVPVDVRDAVTKGLKWLADRQNKDGSWSGGSGLQPTLVTATAGLALLMEGSTPAEGVYAPNIRKAVEWIEKTTKDTGPLANSDPNEQFQYIQNHTAAMLFLACAYDGDTDKDRRARVKKLLDRAVAFLADCRSTRGGWGNVRARDNGNYDDVYTTTQVLHALIAASKAGINVPHDLTDKAVDYLVKCTGSDGGVTFTLTGRGPTAPGQGQPYLSAAAAAAVGVQHRARPGVFPAWVKHALAAADFTNLRTNGAYGLVIHLHVARIAFALGETGHGALAPDVRAEQQLRWSAHRAKLYKGVKDIQGKDGQWVDAGYGSEYATAVALMILQLDNDYLPAFSR